MDWLDLTAGLFDACEQGGETAVLRDPGGNLVEGPGFNIFVVKDGRVATATAEQARAGLDVAKQVEAGDGILFHPRSSPAGSLGRCGSA
jgi:hypothetical protein